MSDSLITKRAIAKSLKDLMSEKYFEKITITDITENCGLSRISFYNHFEDKYDLLNWIFYNDVIIPFKEELNISTWNENFKELLIKMKSEERFYKNALSNTNNEFENYLIFVSKDIFIDTINKLVGEKEITEEEKNFIAEFFAFGITQTISRWAQSGMKQPPEKLADNLYYLIEDTKRYTIERYYK